MKAQLKKMLLLAGILCVMVFAVWGCENSLGTGEETTISGKVLSLDGDMQFKILARNRVVKEDGSTETKGRGHKRTVLYDEETVFYIWTMNEDGSNSETTEATAGDMAEAGSVWVTGNYEGKKFHAKEIKILKFE